MRAGCEPAGVFIVRDFPSFSEGLSLRGCVRGATKQVLTVFPFLFGGTFIEG